MGVANAASDYLQPGFSLPRDARSSILVVYPAIIINKQAEKGAELPDVEWIAAAHTNFEATLKEASTLKPFNLRFMSFAEMTQRKSVYEETMAAFGKRTGEIIFKVPQGSGDVTKAKKCKCTYDLSEVKDKVQAEFGPADYALIVYQYDTYASTGQILGELAGAVVQGLSTPQGSAMPMRRARMHAGNALLFDLHTGAIVWFHGDGAFGGDLREKTGAKVRLEQAMTGFPAPK